MMRLLFEDKGRAIPNHRRADYNIDPIFINRWSPRAFDPTPIGEDILMSIFEAARWSMSCFNEQPWLFLYATERDDRELYRSILSESNKRWTGNAPVIGFIFAKRRFDINNKENHWAEFDCGAAWMALTLQARMMGLYTHGMAGFDREKVYEITGVPGDDYQVIAAFVLGAYGDKQSLPDDKKKTERPNDRKPVNEMIRKGNYNNKQEFRD
jgi:nitroreductase